MSNLSAHVDRAVRRVEQFDEDPRMVVVVATDGSGLSMDQREAVLEQTRQQTATVVADGSGHDVDIKDIGEPRGDGESWVDVADRLDESPDWPVGLGAVLYNDRSDRPEDRRDLWHVTTRLVDHDGSNHFYELWDGTHTRRQFYHIEDLLADFAPAGWCWPTGWKPLYHLTRRCGADDPADLMTDGSGFDDGRCPACDAEGDLEKTLAPGQRRCPTPVDQCAVITFLEGPLDV
ncbi:hypothetical protein NDI85_21410 [Halomicroarcula sp. S1AR25-4]|uniref:hypothetical protein n=1 Tax=Haloarcula sp. S1AR25-4 TaxID=2950538 RepID=UPI002875A7D7|nr:hypothetical protein [Halomicroarcula sp. S1AR25-4]MDS0280347.1 hypothetical protein [Halomicroarcula sp. S1AR25-4]